MTSNQKEWRFTVWHNHTLLSRFREEVNIFFFYFRKDRVPTTQNTWWQLKSLITGNHIPIKLCSLVDAYTALFVSSGKESVQPLEEVPTTVVENIPRLPSLLFNRWIQFFGWDKTVKHIETYCHKNRSLIKYLSLLHILKKISINWVYYFFFIISLKKKESSS